MTGLWFRAVILNLEVILKPMGKQRFRKGVERQLVFVQVMVWSFLCCGSLDGWSSHQGTRDVVIFICLELDLRKTHLSNLWSNRLTWSSGEFIMSSSINVNTNVVCYNLDSKLWELLLSIKEGREKESLKGGAPEKRRSWCRGGRDEGSVESRRRGTRSRGPQLLETRIGRWALEYLARRSSCCRPDRNFVAQLNRTQTAPCLTLFFLESPSLT